MKRISEPPKAPMVPMGQMKGMFDESKCCYCGKDLKSHTKEQLEVCRTNTFEMECESLAS